MGRVVRISAGGIGQWFIATASWVGLVRIMATFGSDVLAGYTIAIRILIFTLLPSWGLSNAAATLVGQNLGAGKPERAEKSVWVTGLGNMVFLGIVSVIFIIFADFFVGLFSDQAAVLAAGSTSLRYMAYGYVAWAIGMVIIQGLNGAGDTVTPTIINFFCFWMLELPLAYLLAMRWGFDERGVLLAMIVSEAMVGLVSIIVFRRGKWKERQV
jgi:Na+-driven multidrug efflux pump